MKLYSRTYHSIHPDKNNIDGFLLMEALISLVIVSALIVLSFKTHSLSQSFQQNNEITLAVHYVQQNKLAKQWVIHHNPGVFLNLMNTTVTEHLSDCYLSNQSNEFQSCRLNELALSHHNLYFHAQKNRWMMPLSTLQNTENINCLEVDGTWIEARKSCFIEIFSLNNDSS